MNQEEVGALARRLKVPRPIAIGMELYACATELFPEQCLNILTGFHIQNNRRKKPVAITQYAADMLNGQYTLDHQAIAFNSDGELCDGQNRLHGGVESETPFPTLIVFNIPEDSMINIDSGNKRSVVDASRIAGHELRNQRASAIKFLVQGGAVRRMSYRATLAAAEILAEPLAFLDDVFPTAIKRMTIAPVSAAIGRAYYYVPERTLRRFCDTMRTGVVSDHATESAAAIFYRWLIGSNGAGAGFNKLAYEKTQKAISVYAEGRKIARLIPADEDLYPLPIDVRQKLQPVRCGNGKQ